MGETDGANRDSSTAPVKVEALVLDAVEYAIEYDDETLREISLRLQDERTYEADDT